MQLIPARNPSSWTGPTGNNTYLLTGAVPALVDAGVGDPGHIDEIARALDGASLSSVLITHGHSDHTAGIPALVARWPAVRVLQYPGIGPNPIRAGDTELQPIHTPGHSPDHVCFLDTHSRDVYCGDLVRLGGTIVIPSSRGGNMQQYLDSLRRIAALPPQRLLPAHDGIIETPLAVIDAYLRHREARSHQVLDALRAGRTTPESIAMTVYAGLAPSLRAAAADTVLAHLVQLEAQGKAISRDGGWAAA
jgi:glyoxylase-like metal-dependent hydrolase (beta-lactamase superfamily II)